MYQVIKRDGKKVDFDLSKITEAIRKAFEAQNRQYNMDIIEMLALKVTADFEKKIKDVDKDFCHPGRVVNFLKDELHSSCIEYSHNGEHCENDCERRLSWWPILTCKQAQWQIFEFRKEV